MTTIIDVKNLSFRYSKKTDYILNDVSFSVKEGSVNVLVGLNGSGKTTLIKILSGLIEGYEGGVSLEGKNLKDIPIKERAKILAYVSQRNHAIDDFTVREYLLFSRVNSLKFYESPKKEDEEKALKYAEKFKITHLLDKNLGEISGGERQIVSICASIIQNTKIVILDEPTSALDMKNQDIVLSIIKEIAKEDNKTFILSSHNPNHALYLNSNVIVLNKGKITCEGNTENAISLERLKEVYGENICYSDTLHYREITFKPRG